VNGSAGSEANPAACQPLAVVRRLYDVWNAGDVAGAAQLVSPAVRWESFGTSPPVDVAEGLRATLAGGAWGETRSSVTVDLLVGVIDHVIACSRRETSYADGDAERLEVWTVRDGRAVHYRGYPLDAGLTVLSQTTGSGRLEAVCRGLLALNRGDVDDWVQLFDPDVEFVCEREVWPAPRLDDVTVLAESSDALVISAVRHLHDPSRAAPVDERLYVVIDFEGDRARRVSGHATPEAALSAAAATGA
jgi:ketosteroid isomerase-like protein